MNTLKERVEQLAGFCRGVNMPSFVYELLIRKGVFWPGAKLPKGYRRGGKKKCYMNAAKLALDNSDVTYVEGVALRPWLGIVIEHAWCVDKDGVVIDRTWDKPEECEYFGVPISTDVLRARLLKTGYYGLFSTDYKVNVDFLMELQPELAELLSQHTPDIIDRGRG